MFIYPWFFVIDFENNELEKLFANLKRIIAFRKYHVIVIKFTETTLAEKIRKIAKS